MSTFTFIRRCYTPMFQNFSEILSLEVLCNIILQVSYRLIISFAFARYRVGALLDKQNEESKEQCATWSRKSSYEQVCKPGVRLPHLSITILDEKFQRTSKVSVYIF